MRPVYQLLKPGLALSVVLTVIPGLLLTPGLPSVKLTVATLIGTMLAAMSSFAYNQIIEEKTDALMDRTRDRAIPSGKLDPALAQVVASTLLGVSLIILWVYAGWLSAFCAFMSFLFYVFIYTILLKPKTVQSTVLGGLCGAVGPLIGEAAVRQTITTEGVALFLLVFFWQPPHFWALAIFRRNDYEKAGFPVMPVTDGIRPTITQMALYQILLLIAMLFVFYPLGIGSYIFLASSLPFGVFLLFLIFQLYKKTESIDKAARNVFFLTIFHNMLWHGSLTIDLLLDRS